MRGGGYGEDNANYRHGMSSHPLYYVYNGMKERCYNPETEYWHHYGGRGITVCQRWLEGFQYFYEDMGDRPDGYQLDRIDNNGPYCKENCRWVSSRENCSNTRRNVKFKYDGELLTISEIARRSGIHLETLRSRLKAGHSIEEALRKVKWSKPVK